MLVSGRSPAKQMSGARMHTVLHKLLMCGLFVMMFWISQDTARSQEPYLARPSFLAMGDPAAGRRAYLSLKCNTCHTVVGEPIGAKRPRLAGPQLGKSVALQPPEQIADSITVPNHVISKTSGPWQLAGSSMGDYTHIMTVRQLMDLVAYLRSL